MAGDELEAARAEAYEMGYKDGQGDLPDAVEKFLLDLIAHKAFRQLSSDLQQRARRFVQMGPDTYL